MIYKVFWSLSLVISCVASSRVRPGVVVSGGVVVSRSGLRKLSRGFSSARRPLLDASLSRSVILWTASVKPVSIDALWLSLLLSLLRRWVGSTAGAAIPNFSLLPTSGVYLRSVCLSIVCLSDPPLTRTPRSCVRTGSHLVCLKCGFNKNSKDFLQR